MSFQEDVKRHQDALLRMVDAGVPVAAAALAVGITRGRAYEMLAGVRLRRRPEDGGHR